MKLNGMLHVFENSVQKFKISEKDFSYIILFQVVAKSKVSVSGCSFREESGKNAFKF